MKNVEKVTRISNWKEPGLIKKMGPWREWEKSEERFIPDEIKKSDENRKKESLSNKFKKWNLPDQPENYIKTKRHDFL